MPRPVSGPRAGSSAVSVAPPTVTRPPAGVWRRALATRLARTSRMRTGSMSRIGRSPSMAAVSSTPAVAAAASNERTTSATSSSGSVGSRWSASVPGLRQGQRPQVVDQPGQHARLVEDDREMRGVRRVDAVDDRLEVALDDRQRRPQLVADLGEQRPPLAFVGLEPRGHRVEARDQLADGAQATSASARRGPCSRRPRPRGSPRRARRGSAADDRNPRPTPTRTAATTTSTMRAGPALRSARGRIRSPRRATRRRPGRRARRRSRTRARRPPRAGHRPTAERPSPCHGPPARLVRRRTRARSPDRRVARPGAGISRSPDRRRIDSRRRRRSARSAAGAGRARACGAGS